MNDSFITSYGGGKRSETLDASYYKGAGSRNGKERDFMIFKNKGRRYIVRRLTPLECARLQGFPDDWTDDVPGSDSSKYKMWGNGMAYPVIHFIMEGIRDALRTEWLDHILDVEVPDD